VQTFDNWLTGDGAAALCGEAVALRNCDGLNSSPCDYPTGVCAGSASSDPEGCAAHGYLNAGKTGYNHFFANRFVSALFQMPGPVVFATDIPGLIHENCHFVAQ
jgi:hypothetical protein